MTRRKQKRQNREAAEYREQRIEKLLSRGWIQSAHEIPSDAIPVDPDVLRYGWTYDGPLYYRDKPFTCRDCGKMELWKAEDQRWYYEVVRADVSRTAVRCLTCRHAERERKAEARRRAGHHPPE